MTTIKQAIKELNQCNGDCKHCEHWRIKTAALTDHITVYAHYCDITNKTGYIWYGERLATLREETLSVCYLKSNLIEKADSDVAKGRDSR